MNNKFVMREKELAWNAGYRDYLAGKHTVNSSDVYGPFNTEYQAGYNKARDNSEKKDDR